MPPKKKKSSVKKKRPVTKRKIIRKKPKKSKPSPKKSPKLLAPKEKVVGPITHYFPHVNAAVLKVKIPLSVGDEIWIKGHTTDFKQKITSMQIDRVIIQTAKKGDEIGLQVESRVRRKDMVYKA